MKVIKRNGDKVEFNKNNIIEAIKKSFVECNEFFDIITANSIADKIKYDTENKELTVEQIQDLVIDELMRVNKDVAKAYILFRYNKHPKGNLLGNSTLEFKPKSIYNENGDDSISKKRIIDGNPTNLQVFNNKKYKWTDEIYKVSMANFWIPEEISLVDDISMYRNLNTDEKTAFDKILSFLIFLDSVQANNLTNINNYITASEINMCISIQQYQENLHSQSYSYIMNTICNPDEIDEVIYQWREDPILKKRNKFIGDLYNTFNDVPSRRNFAKVLVANYCLEGILFYSGFLFFYNLERLNKVSGIAQEIKYINRDESVHLNLFNSIITNLMTERPDIFDEELMVELREIVLESVRQEIEFGHHIIGDRIEGLNKELIADYITYLGNLRLISLNMKPINNVTINPCEWVDKMSDSNNVKADFFEARSSAYSVGSYNNDL